MRSPDLVLFASSLGIVVAAVGLYLRRRHVIHRISRSGEPLAVDGWLLTADEPEYVYELKKQGNEAFRAFCQLSLFGILMLGAAYGLNLKHDIFSFPRDVR